MRRQGEVWTWISKGMQGTEQKREEMESEIPSIKISAGSEAWN